MPQAGCDDLMLPPSNRLEKLKGELREFHSIRINDQWRVIFRSASNMASRTRDGSELSIIIELERHGRRRIEFGTESRPKC